VQQLTLAWITVLLSWGCVAVATGAMAQSSQDALVGRALMARQQQMEELSLKIRQSQQLHEAQAQGASASELRDLQSLQSVQRWRQESLHSEQLLRMQTLPPSAGAPEVRLEATNAQRERDLQGLTRESAVPSWGIRLD